MKLNKYGKLSATVLFVVMLIISNSFVFVANAVDMVVETEISDDVTNADTTEITTTPVVTEPADDYNKTDVDLFGFSVNPSELTLAVGESCKLNVIFNLPVYCEESVIYQSSRGTVASVSTDGVVTAISEGTAILSVSAKLDTEKIDLEDNTDIVRTVNVLVNIIPDNSLSLEQQNKLSALKKKESILLGEFTRAEKEILGEINADVSRITLMAMNEIINGSISYKEIYQKLISFHKYPDFCGGSGVTLTEYWFDDIGKEKIILIDEEENISYVSFTDDGQILECRMLFHDTKKSEMPVRDTFLVKTYKIYNDIDETVSTTTETMSFSESTTTTTATTTSTTTAVVFKPQISEDDILLLSKKGESLTWSDFERYEYSDIGSGLFVWKLSIKNSSSELLIGGKSLDEKPDYINYVTESGAIVDIRLEDLTHWFYDDVSTTTSSDTTETSSVTTVATTTDIESTLPQTGYSNIYKVIAGLAAFLTVSGTVIVVKTRRENE